MREMKDSGIQWIGKIPKNWDVRPIKNSFSIVSGSTPDSDKAEYWEGDVPWITPADFKTIDKYTSGGSRFITEKGYDSCSTNMIPKGSIIFSKRAPIGSVVINKIDLCTNQGCLSCIKNDKTDSTYFYYLMSIYDDVFNLFGSGTTFKEISATTFGNFILPLPPLMEQHLVSSFLDSKCSEIDALTADIQKEIETLQEYRKSVITEAVTKGLDPNVEMKDSLNPYVGQINAEWNEKKTKYSFRIRKDIAGYEGPTVLSITQKGIRPKSLKYGEGQQAENYSNYQHVSIGNYAMNHMDLLTGWSDISKYEGVTSPDYRVFILTDETDCIPEYYLYFFQMCYFNKIFYKLGRGVSGFGRWRLPAEQFLNFVIPKPSKKEQKDIASYLDTKCAEIDSIIVDKQKQLETLAEYRKSLIYEYETGKKEVPTA